MVLASLLFMSIGVDDLGHMMDDLLNQLDYWMIFLLAVIVAPAFEEVLFRYYITKPLLALVFLTMLGGIMIYILLSAFSLPSFLAIAISIVAVLTSVFIMSRSGQREAFIKKYNAFFPYVFYASAVIFAIVHISNFNTEFPWYWSPILVFPQFFLALYLGYVRVRNGLRYSILFHAINNIIPMILLAVGPMDS